MFKIFEGELTKSIDYTDLDGALKTCEVGTIMDMYLDDDQAYAIGPTLTFTVQASEYTPVSS